MPDAPTLVTVTRAGQVTGVSERQIRRWIAAGRLPVTTGERGRLVDLAAVRHLAGHFAGSPDNGPASDRLLPDGIRHLDRHEPDTALTQALALVDRLSCENVELAGRCGFYQSEIQHLKERITLLEAPKPDPSDPAPTEPANRSAPEQNGLRSGAARSPRPWWKFWEKES